MNRLYLVRHGENKANLTKEFSYKLVDYSLTDKGVEQAKQTATYFADKHIQEIYASPLKRAIETAEIIAAQVALPVVVMENLREVNVGALEGQPVSAENWAVYQQIFDDWFEGKLTTRFPEGEDYDTLWARMQAGLKQIVARKANKNIVVVGHGGIFTVTLKDLCPNVDPNALRQGPNHNCSITEIMTMLRGERLEAELIFWASYAHLHGTAADLVAGTPQSGEELDL